jgi:hypothetical protein
VDNVSRMAGMPAANRQTLDGTALLLIRSAGDQTGSMILKDMQGTMSAAGRPGQPPLKRTLPKIPPIVIQGFQEDGKLSAEMRGNPQEALMRVLFPLPPKPLKVGESVDLPMRMPFNVMGTQLFATGRCRAKLTGYVDIAGHTCARLEGDIDISDLKVPQELRGKYRFTSKGKSVMYFDVPGRRFARVDLALKMSAQVEAPSPAGAVAAQGGPQLKGMPKTLRMAMDSDNLIELRHVPGQPKAQGRGQ